MAARFELHIAAYTHQGRRRKNNEDCIVVDDWIHGDPMLAPVLHKRSLSARRLCAVADGMGGHAAGEVASRFAIEHLVSRLPPTMPDAQAVADALLQVNRELFAEMQRNVSLRGMGTTIAGALIDGNAMVIFNIGDSRIYRLGAGAPARLSVDDVPNLQLPGLDLPYKTGAVTQCLGGAREHMVIAPHVSRHGIAAGDTYLICSDGLSDMIDDADIGASVDADLAESARVLFDKAMARGGMDNISILLLRVVKVVKSGAARV
jgi:serine/threonine protein phosphatase PrpC